MAIDLDVSRRHQGSEVRVSRVSLVRVEFCRGAGTPDDLCWRVVGYFEGVDVLSSGQGTTLARKFLVAFGFRYLTP